MLKYLSPNEQSRFSELQGKLAQLLISEAEQQELVALVGKAQQSAVERAQALESVRKMIAENGIGIQTLFSAEQIARAAAQFLAGPKARKQPAVKAREVKAAPGTEQVLIQVKLDKGACAPSRYKKGQKLGKFVSRNFKQLDVGQELVENLLKYATPSGRSYFSTEQGRSELESFAQYIRQTPVSA